MAEVPKPEVEIDPAVLAQCWKEFMLSLSGRLGDQREQIALLTTERDKWRAKALRAEASLKRLRRHVRVEKAKGRHNDRR